MAGSGQAEPAGWACVPVRARGGSLQASARWKKLREGRAEDRVIFLSPLRGLWFFLAPHPRLRRGLHSFAASRLGACPTFLRALTDSPERVSYPADQASLRLVPGGDSAFRRGSRERRSQTRRPAS